MYINIIGSVIYFKLHFLIFLLKKVYVQETIKRKVKDVMNTYPLVMKPRKTVLRGLGIQLVNIDQDDRDCTQLTRPLVAQAGCIIVS